MLFNPLTRAVNKVAFRPPAPSYRKQDVVYWIETDTGAWIPAVHVQNGTPITLLVSHGNAEDLGDCVRVWYRLAQLLKANLLCYEYPGYGHATGTPSEEELYSSARAALRLLVEKLQVPHSAVVLVGKSIGS
ncbi:MAG: hypothetical protein SGPRY_001738, partial [Prymnesium sp.]